MSTGLMLGWLVCWPGVCVNLLACERVLHAHVWICVFLLLCLWDCMHVCLSSYLTECEHKKAKRNGVRQII